MGNTLYNVAPRWGLDSADRFRISGFGHLVGPIMGVFALLEGDCAILFMYIFPTHSGIGVIFSAKLGQKRQFCARNGTNWHAATRKVVKKCCFTHLNDLFLQQIRGLLLPNLYIPRQGGGFRPEGQARGGR
jgi:hypothetical protein